MDERQCACFLPQVIDETDRLLRQAYQDWLPFVTAATVGGPGDPPVRGPGGQPVGGPQRHVLKIVASATLTRDPSKIERLGLNCPRYIALGASDHRHATILHLLSHAQEFCPLIFCCGGAAVTMPCFEPGHSFGCMDP